jgi:hypothetical protein
MINTDKTKLMEFGNKVMAFKGILKQYITRLNEMEKQAIELITTLKKEYHLK